MPTSGERNTPQRSGDFFTYPLDTGAKINKGAIVCLDAGLAKAGATGVGLFVPGIARESVDQTNGDQKVTVRRGHFKFNNSAAADELTAADVGKECYLVDDETVAKTDGGGTRSVAAIVHEIEGGKVWLEF